LRAVSLQGTDQPAEPKEGVKLVCSGGISGAGAAQMALPQAPDCPSLHLVAHSISGWFFCLSAHSDVDRLCH